MRAMLGAAALAVAAPLLWSGGAEAMGAPAKPSDFGEIPAILAQQDAARLPKAVDVVLARADAAPADVLLLAAAGALRLGRVEDAGFLFYAGQLRMRVDLRRFEAKDQGGGHPSGLLGALMLNVGQAVNPAIMADPPKLAAALERVAAWDAYGPPGYDPGWPYTEMMPEKEGRAFVRVYKAGYMAQGLGISTLLHDPDYFAAYQNLASLGNLEPKQQSKPENQAKRALAEQRCRAIEEKRGIPGLFYRKQPVPPGAR